MIQATPCATTTVRGKCDTHLRRSGGGRSPGTARVARNVFAWIPAYAGTTIYLSLATFKAQGLPRFFAPIVGSVTFPGQ